MKKANNRAFASICHELGIGYIEYERFQQCIKVDAQIIYNNALTWCNPDSGAFYDFNDALKVYTPSVDSCMIETVGVYVYIEEVIRNLKKLGMEFRTEQGPIMFRI